MLPPLHIGRHLAGWLAAAVAYSLAVGWIVHALDLPKWTVGNEVAAVLTAVLGGLLVFRTNAANDRWWEARKLWGQLINDIRNLALKARAFAEVDDTERRQFAKLLIGFAHALRLHLRGVGGIQSIPGFKTENASIPHGPGYVAELVYQTLDRWNRQNKLAGTIWLLDHHARSLMDICGACERIRNTPLASSYRALLRGGLALYVLTAPWAVAVEMGWWGVLVLAVGIGFLIGIELTAEMIEEPFGHEGDELPLEDYCRAIETFVNAALNGAGAAVRE